MSAASTARVPTANGSRYLVQLCKHWTHRFPHTTYADGEGRVPFGPDRACLFSADPDGLTMRLEVADPALLDRMESVVVEHLKRFAFREDFGEIAWTREG